MTEETKSPLEQLEDLAADYKLNKSGDRRGMLPENRATLVPATKDHNPGAFKSGEEHTEAKAHRNMRSRARKYTDLALEALVEVATQSKNLAAKVDAAQELLTRGYGRPHVQQDGKEKAPATKINVSFGEGSQAVIGRPFLPGIDPRRPHNHPNLKTVNGEATDLTDESADGRD